LFDQDPETERAAEVAVWRILLPLGRLLLTALLARRCYRLALEDMQGRGLAPNQIRFRLDKDYWSALKSTLGLIRVPKFAYRYQNRCGAYVTHTPSGSVFPLHPRCRSSTMLLQWETKLGAETVFRNAEHLLQFLTHGAVSIHDTTIASHCQVVASVVDREWLYQSPVEIREILRTRAVRDERSGKPLLFMSCDGHAERVYQGETWSTVHQMFNGIRLWCVDQVTRRIIHLGGEFLVADCHGVSAAFADIKARGIVPGDGDYGGGVVAHLVFVADGMPWFDDHILPHFDDIEAVLDGYHVLERIATFLAKVYEAGSTSAKRLYNRLCRFVTGRAPRNKKSKPRRGTRRKNAKIAPYDKERSYPSWDHTILTSRGLPDHSGGALIAELQDLEIRDSLEHHKLRAGLINYLSTRIDRIRYDEFWDRGFMISSAPMESFNRVAQHRIKRPGTTWTPAMAQAILNLRMMAVVGRDEAFWANSDVRGNIAKAFSQQVAA